MAYGDFANPSQPVGYYQGPDGQWYDSQGRPVAASNAAGITNPIETAAPATDPNAPDGRTGPITATHGGTADSGGTASAGSVGQPTAPATPPIVSGGAQSVPAFSGVNYPQFQAPALPSSLQTPFTLPTANDLIANDPGYMARYQQGLDANQRSAAAQGTLLNGGTQKALAQYGSDYAQGEYGQYVQQKLAERQQQASDYLSLAYGPAWQQNQGAVNQYGQLYSQYQNLIGANRNASNDYIQALLQQQQIGANAAGAPPSTSTSNV